MCNSAVSVPIQKPGEPEKDHWDVLSIPMLKMELQKLKLPTRGKKGDLIARLRDAAGAAHDGTKDTEQLDIKPGIEGLGSIATAQVCLTPLHLGLELPPINGPALHSQSAGR